MIIINYLGTYVEFSSGAMVLSVALSLLPTMESFGHNLECIGQLGLLLGTSCLQEVHFGAVSR